MDNASEFSLCSTCSEIPLDLFFSEGRDSEWRIWDPPPLDKWTETCSLCMFLLKCLPIRALLRCAGQRAWANLDSWSWRKDPYVQCLRFSVSPDSDSTTKISLNPMVCVASKRQRTVPQPKMVSPLISFATITEWMNRTTPYLESREEPAEELRSTVPLIVVDCTTRKLILLPEKEPYVTLSYVWGSVNSSQTAPGSGKYDRESLPLQIPSTIEDCITVCLGLNFRYLWVDRYCIYGSHDTRAQQIKQMDRVYSESALTVIACAGVDSTHGLPGVSHPRTSYPSLKVKDLGYILAVPALEEIDSSIWGTRGWTFQEALLSKRQLYFTDKQLFFGVYDKIEWESLDWLSKEASSASKSQHSLGDLTTYGCIEAYSRRQLSYPDDILNAFLGVLSRLQKDRGVLHLWGLPFSHDLVFEESLCWDSTKRTRREGFPTWSWTSNDGAVQWSLPRKVDCGPSYPGSAPKFEVELMSGELCSLSKYQLRYDDLNNYSEGLLSKDRPSRFIHIEAFVSSVFDIEPQSYFDRFVVRSTTHEPISIEVSRNTESAPTSPGSNLIIHLIYGGHDNENYALAVSNMGDHWERVGIVYDWTNRLVLADKFRKKIRLG